MLKTPLKTVGKVLISLIALILVLINAFILLNPPKDNQINLPNIPNVEESEDDLIDKELSDLTEQEKKGMLFMATIPDKYLDSATESFLKENKIVGVILLGANIESEEQLKQLTKDLREKVSEDLFIAIDQEGGTVVRIKWDKYADVSARDIGQLGDTNYAYEIAKYRGELLKSLGINVILGPVADIAYNQDSFLVDRSFGNNKELVSRMVEATVKGQKDAGIITVLKHFPGHGRTSVDSHSELPVINLTKEQLLAEEFVPFKAGIDAGAEMIMFGHIINANISAKPASIASEYLSILEDDLGFSGIVITDDLNMAGGIPGTLDYGINLTLESRAKIIERMNSITPQEEYVKRLLKLK